MWYKYWSNKNEWHGELLFECQADKLTEADKLFEAETGIDPRKVNWIGCQCLPVPERSWLSYLFGWLFR